MKKLILLVAILSTVSFVSCGKNETQVIEEAPIPAQSETESEEKSEANLEETEKTEKTEETEETEETEVTVEEQPKTEEIPQPEEKKSEEEIAELAQEEEPKALEKQDNKYSVIITFFSGNSRRLECST